MSKVMLAGKSIAAAIQAPNGIIGMSIQLVEPPAIIATSPMQETCLSPNRFAMMPAGSATKAPGRR